jgi:hypothetical protein
MLSIMFLVCSLSGLQYSLTGSLHEPLPTTIDLPDRLRHFPARLQKCDTSTVYPYIPFKPHYRALETLCVYMREVH